MRTITIGTWSGYRADQSRVVHCTVHKGKSPYRDISAVQFTDGTTLDLEHRPAAPREKVKEIHGYTKLLDDFRFGGFKGYCRVQDLVDRRKETKQ